MCTTTGLTHCADLMIGAHANLVLETRCPIKCADGFFAFLARRIRGADAAPTLNLGVRGA